MLNRGTYVLLLRKSKREFYGNLNEKKLSDNKKFRGVVKPVVLSNKNVSNEKITLVELGTIVENEKKNCNCSQRFFLRYHN